MKKFNRYLEFDSVTASEASSSASPQPEGTSSGGALDKTPKMVTPGVGPDTNKPPCRKAKELRKERKREKQQQGLSKENSPEVTSVSAQTTPSECKKSIEDLLPNPDKYLAHKFEKELIQSCPLSPEFKSTFKELYALYRKYQVIMSVHKDKPSDASEKQFTQFLVDFRPEPIMLSNLPIILSRISQIFYPLFPNMRPIILT